MLLSSSHFLWGLSCAWYWAGIQESKINETLSLLLRRLEACERDKHINRWFKCSEIRSRLKVNLIRGHLNPTGRQRKLPRRGDVSASTWTMIWIIPKRRQDTLRKGYWVHKDLEEWGSTACVVIPSDECVAEEMKWTVRRGSVQRPFRDQLECGLYNKSYREPLKNYDISHPNFRIRLRYFHSC